MPERVRVQGDLFHGRAPAGAIYVGRAFPGLGQSPFANPFVVRRTVPKDGCCCTWAVSHHRSRGRITGCYPARQEALVQAVRQYRDYLALLPALRDRAAEELRGKDLACWCPLPKLGEPDLCHAAVLLKVANGEAA